MLNKWAMAVLLPAMAGQLLAGCTAGGKTARNGKDRLVVVSTTGMINDAVRNIGGDKVEAIGLMGPGIDPHLYRATADDVRKLDSASLIFYNGLELEGRMTEIFAKMKSRGTPTYPVTAGIPLTELRNPPEFKGKHDPHVWFDVELWKYAAESVRDGLVQSDPPNRDHYEENARKYLETLDQLHSYVTKEAASLPPGSRVLVTAHDAFGYFGRKYGFEVFGIQGTSTASEAGAQRIIQLADLIAKRKVKAIFVETSVPEATIKALQKAVQGRGWDVQVGGKLFSDAMGDDGTKEGTYDGMVRHNIDSIVKALR